MVRTKSVFFIVTVVFLLCFGFTGWENLTAISSVCGGDLINSSQCSAHVSNKVFLTVLELVSYLVIPILLYYVSKNPRA